MVSHDQLPVRRPAKAAMPPTKERVKPSAPSINQGLIGAYS